MANIVEFVLRLKDMMSGGMQGAARTAQNALSGVNTAANSANRTINQIGNTAQLASRNSNRSIATLERALRMLDRRTRITVDIAELTNANRRAQQLRTEIERLRNIGTSSLPTERPVTGGGMFGNVRGLIAGAGVTMGLKTAVSAGMDAQQQKASFEVMAGKEAGGQLFSDLTKFAQDSIFGNEVYKNAQTMKAFGMETQNVMPTLRMLGDVSMGNKDRLNSLSLAYSQIQATGRLMGQDLLQLVNAGFNPLQVISDKTGMSMADLKKKMEDGAISAKMVEMAFQAATTGGQFHNMTNQIAQTDFGKLEAFKGQLDGLAMKIGGYLAPVVGNFITNYLEPFIDNLGKTADWIAKNAEWIKPLVLGLGSLIGVYQTIVGITKLWTTVQGLLNIALISNPIGLVIAAIVALIALIVYLVSKTEGWGKAWGHVVNAAKYLWQAFVDDAKLSFNNMVNTLMIGLNKIKEGWYSFKNAVGLGDSTQNDQFLTEIAADTDRRKKEMIDGAQNVALTYAKGMAELSAAGNSIKWKDGKTMAESKQTVMSALGMTNNDFKKGLGAGTGTKTGTNGISSKGITHSGPQAITVIINKEMIGKIELRTVNMREGVGEIESIVEEMMLRLFQSLKTAN